MPLSRKFQAISHWSNGKLHFSLISWYNFVAVLSFPLILSSYGQPRSEESHKTQVLKGSIRVQFSVCWAERVEVPSWKAWRFTLYVHTCQIKARELTEARTGSEWARTRQMETSTWFANATRVQSGFWSEFHPNRTHFYNLHRRSFSLDAPHVALRYSYGKSLFSCSGRFSALTIVKGGVCKVSSCTRMVCKKWSETIHVQEWICRWVTE